MDLLRGKMANFPPFSAFSKVTSQKLASNYLDIFREACMVTRGYVTYSFWVLRISKNISSSKLKKLASFLFLGQKCLKSVRK